MKTATNSAVRILVSTMLAGVCLASVAQAQQPAMTFFVTSVGKGNGADLGGLGGADAHCAALAKAAGSAQSNWRAYLSTTAENVVFRHVTPPTQESTTRSMIPFMLYSSSNYPPA